MYKNRVKNLPNEDIFICDSYRIKRIAIEILQWIFSQHQYYSCVYVH